MTGTTILSAFVALFMLTVASFVGSTTTARAQQNPNCCTYTVAIDGIRPACFPFRIAFRWSCFSDQSSIVSYPGNGSYTAPIPGFTPCPPACRLADISLDGVNYVGPNETKRFVIGNCCYLVSFLYDTNGCIYIKIGPC